MFKFVDKIEDANCITHGAKFHADDVFCTVLLSTLIDDMKLIRVLEVPEEYKNRDDVFIYDIGWGEFDHHQKGGNGQRENGIKYAAFGLIWKKYGKEYLEKIGIKADYIDLVWQYLEEEFIQITDSIDNGQLDTSNVEVQLVTVSDVIGFYNPNWNENKSYDEAFKEACLIAKTIWDKKVNSVLCKVQAKEEVDIAIEKSEGGIIVLEKYMPYQDFILQSKNPKAEKILYAIYPSNRGGFGIQAIQKYINSFENRKPFPENWAGLKGEELQQVTGVETARFCHNSRFLCTTDTFEDALIIAKKAVES